MSAVSWKIIGSTNPLIVLFVHIKLVEMHKIAVFSMLKEADTLSRTKETTQDSQRSSEEGVGLSGEFPGTTISLFSASSKLRT